MLLSWKNLCRPKSSWPTWPTPACVDHAARPPATSFLIMSSSVSASSVWSAHSKDVQDFSRDFARQFWQNRAITSLSWTRKNHEVSKGPLVKKNIVQRTSSTLAIALWQRLVRFANIRGLARSCDDGVAPINVYKNRPTFTLPALLIS